MYSSLYTVSTSHVLASRVPVSSISLYPSKCCRPKMFAVVGNISDVAIDADWLKCCRRLLSTNVVDKCCSQNVANVDNISDVSVDCCRQMLLSKVAVVSNIQKF